MSENIQFFHKTKIQIRFNDIDGLGHVNNTTVQEYFDLGRLEYFNAVFNYDVNWNEFAAIIASIKTDFVLPVFLKDQLWVKTKITGIGTKSMKLAQYLVDDKDNLKAICASVMVGFDQKKQISIAIPNEWRLLINKIEEDCNF
ncbi:acyl-CoA thioesterase [Labilibacter sediminis]|nr:acyl-CoA thioesterase [Labilibacter sediminis]